MSSSSPLAAFARASSLHIGAAAAAASLRHDLVNDHQLQPQDIDAAYAVSRITPGTNLLALYALLGHRLGGWRLALQALFIGAVVPAVLVLLVVMAYDRNASPTLAALMTGARAGGIAVFLGAAVRLLKPQLAGRSRARLAFAVVAFVVAWTIPVNLFIVLLMAGATGGVLLRP
jgi:chromate transport protein ChrA